MKFTKLSDLAKLFSDFSFGEDFLATEFDFTGFFGFELLLAVVESGEFRIVLSNDTEIINIR